MVPELDKSTRCFHFVDILHFNPTTHIPGGHMKRITALVLFCCLSFSMTPAQEKKDQQTPQKPPQAALDDMMKKMMELASPSDAHKKLEDLVGVWETETKMWMAGEGSGQATTTKGIAENVWILGGRFLRSDFKGEMMRMQMAGFGLTGYDNYAKMYVGMWVDNLSTTLATMEGTFDRSGKVLTMYGKMNEWMTGELGKTVKYVTSVVSKDKHVFEIHDLSIGEPNTKVIEVTYTRKK
jgi:hypothetical protein